MKKTTENIYNKNSLTVDTAGLQGILGSGRRTAVNIGMAAGAKITVGRRVLWNVSWRTHWMRARQSLHIPGNCLITFSRDG